MRKIAIVIFILFLIGFDVSTKWYFSGPFQESVNIIPTSYFPIFGDIFGIQLSYNQGVAFSFPIHGLPLQIITVVIIGILGFFYTRYEYPKNNTWIDVAFACIFAGALSHAYERIFIGQVTDFLAVKYFAILNFADIFISIGACILFILVFIFRKT